MIMIRFVENKNGSLTVYVTAKYAHRFQEMFRAGEIDILESEMDGDEINDWQENCNWFVECR
jgi:hypothetical protein